MLKKLKKGTNPRSKYQLGWTYVALINQDGQPTSFARISYRIRFFRTAIVQVDVPACIAEKLCKELNSKIQN